MISVITVYLLVLQKQLDLNIGDYQVFAVMKQPSMYRFMIAENSDSWEDDGARTLMMFERVIRWMAFEKSIENYRCGDWPESIQQSNLKLWQS